MFNKFETVLCFVCSLFYRALNEKRQQTQTKKRIQKSVMLLCYLSSFQRGIPFIQQLIPHLLLLLLRFNVRLFRLRISEYLLRTDGSACGNAENEQRKRLNESETKRKCLKYARNQKVHVKCISTLNGVRKKGQHDQREQTDEEEEGAENNKKNERTQKLI